MPELKSLLSDLPSVDEILRSAYGLDWLEKYPRKIVVKAVREVINSHRTAIISGIEPDISTESLIDKIGVELKKLSAFSLRKVINATGVVIHTNLGRSILSESIMQHVQEIACGYSNLEYDIEKGARGKRYSHIQNLITEITGAESSLIVNNNAAAVLICLNTLAKGKDVIVSRGELVEIGGSFRIPDVMISSGAILKEVGTTNKTHIKDYAQAINENTALLLKVHQSNFRIIGFTKSLTLQELVSLGKRFQIPVMFDLGSGCLIDLKPYNISIEPSVQEIIKTGVDIVTFSGDKLLGGPQGGIIAGKKKWIDQISHNPLMRALRIDKMTLSAFEATLRCYFDEESAKNQIPTLQMLLQDIGIIKKRAQKTLLKIKKIKNFSIHDHCEIMIIEDNSQSGGGALPEIEFPTFAVALKPYKKSVNSIEKKLRQCNPPIIARIGDERLIFDMRTVRDNEIELLLKGLIEALQGDD